LQIEKKVKVAQEANQVKNKLRKLFNDLDQSKTLQSFDNH